MKYLDIVKNRLGLRSPDEVFSYFLRTLKETITTWDYFVNWSKVFQNVENVEIELNILNSVIGKEEIEKELAFLISRYPEIVKTLPILIASREKSFCILDEFEKGVLKYRHFNFNISKMKITEEDIKNILEFCKKVGIIDLLKSRKIRNVVDYVIGIEVGLDSNGRKNRAGEIMEKIVEVYIKDICNRHGLKYVRQANGFKIKKFLGKSLKIDKSSRILDFAVLTKKGNLYLIETNFYSGGGSKLKATAGEYKTMHDYWKKEGYRFIWITDGHGWKSAHLPLKEVFDKIDYVLNLEMVAKGILEDILLNDL